MDIGTDMTVDLGIEESGTDGRIVADIRRNLETLYSTRAGSLPLARDMGICYDGIVGMPLDASSNKLALEIITATEKYEPRAEVMAVAADCDALSGKMSVHISVTIREDDDD